MKYRKKKHDLGFYQAKPLPSSEKLKQYYSEDYYQKLNTKTYAKKYSPEEKEYFKNVARIAENIWKKFTSLTKGKLLDIGCGEGFFANYFAKNDWDLETCDFSSFGINKHHPHLLENFVQGDIFELLEKRIQENKKYNFINLSFVLEHVLDPLDLLDKIKNLMHNQSLLRIEVPNDFSPFQEWLIHKKQTKETWFSPPDHLNYFHFASLKKVLDHRGFSTVKTLADFPIEIFLANNHSNYFFDKTKGKQAHVSRIEISNFLMKQGIENYINYLSSSADLGFGRSITIFASLKNRDISKPKPTKICSTILVTGCGGDIGTSIGKILKMDEVADRIIGCDIHLEHPGLFNFDKCEMVERADSHYYLENLYTIIKKNKVDFIIPTSEHELRFFSKKEITEIGNIPLILTNKESLNIGFDKLETANFIRQIKLPYPWTISVQEGKPKAFPCIIKNRFGSGNKKVSIIDKNNINHYKTYADDIFQEYLKPDNEEYTCGLYRTKTHHIRMIVFKRKLQGGYTSFGQVVKNKKIENILTRLAEKLNLQGSINVQLILTKKGPVIFEINPRFSSTVLFRHLLGFKDVIWSLKEAAHKNLDPYHPPLPGTKIYKGFQEYVLFNNQT